MTTPRRVLGIDPGSRRTGYGIVEVQGNQCRYVASGCIRLENKPLPERLGEIFSSISTLVMQYNPTEMSIEEVFMARNPQSALKLGQARGVAIAACVNKDLPVFEYAARRVKQAIVGTGTANKDQIQHMVQILLELSGKPQEDAADALAIALCHINSSAAGLIHARS